jgi:uncharacterized membrane protein (UPF0182 family)
MSEMSNLPSDAPFDTRRPLSLFKVIVVGILLIAALSTSVGIYIDKLWFDSLGFVSVYWYGLQARSVAFVAAFAATAVFLWCAFRILLAVTGNARRQLLQVQGRWVEPPSVDTMKPIATFASIVIGLLVATVISSQWETFALYLNRSTTSGVVDPVFGKPLSFYLFTLPVLEWVSGWLLMMSVIVLIVSVLIFGVGLSVHLRGISFAAGLLMIAIAARLFLARYALMLEDHALFSGMNYVADHVTALSLMATTVVLFLGAAVLFSNKSGRLRTIGLGILLPFATQIVGGALIPWYVTTFVVRPNERALETPYIRHNINFTRQAFGLDKVEELPFEPRQTNATFDPSTHRATLDNMRLWDWQALQDTLRQLQEIRTYYDFPDVDIDRYKVDGQLKAMMLATREIDIRKLPAGSRNWVNDRLTYTHGYGVTMNSATEFSREGLPVFTLSNMPVEGPLPSIQVKRPEIYFGEMTNWPVYVKTRQKEFNYPEGDANNSNTYEGTGGIQMGGFFRRLLLALEVGDLTTVPFSNDVSADSSLLLHRNIIDRVQKIAPFLTYDSDPYMVVGSDGALYWMLDGFTTSARYPYSKHISVGNRDVNYIRNSVKAVIDAYNGRVSFYVFDTEDPLIATYQKIFPDLFKPRSAMPPFLAEHVRYPEMLFHIQAEMYSSYHVDNEQVFYNREDVWSIAQQTRTQGGGQSQEGIEPFFILMSFPGSQELEFVSILPFTPSKRNNMIGWMAGRSDGEHYGKLRAYHLPKTKFIDGPLQIQAKIDQEPQLSSQLTLWNQQGSAVIRGNLLAIPIDDTILFAEPIYLQAQRSPMPALRLIVLATQDRLAYATTFDEALKLLLAGGGGSLAQSSTSQAPAETPQQAQPKATPLPAGASTQALITRANQALSDYRRLTAEGKMAEAGAKLDELRNALEQLNRTGGAK